jgi:hypothetical protein
MMGSMVGFGKAPMMSALEGLMVDSLADQEGRAEVLVDKKRRSVVSDDEVRDGVEEAKRRLQDHGGADH